MIFITLRTYPVPVVFGVNNFSVVKYHYVENADIGRLCNLFLLILELSDYLNMNFIHDFHIKKKT